MNVKKKILGMVLYCFPHYFSAFKGNYEKHIQFELHVLLAEYFSRREISKEEILSSKFTSCFLLSENPC